MLEASGAGAFVVAAAGWQVRSAIRRRRARRRRTAAVLSDVIIVGSNSPRSPSGERMGRPRRVTPEVSALERLGETGDQWGFSLCDAGQVICTFVYPGKEKAQAALKAMRRAKKDLAAMELSLHSRM